MNAQLANILKNKLSSIDNGLDEQGQQLPNGLPFIDRMAGLVITGEKAQPATIEGAFTVSKFPISVDADYEECMNKACYKDLVPHSKLKGILYFEGMGTQPLGNDHGNFKYLVRLRLICWINNKLIQGNSENCLSISHKLITKIRSTLEQGIFNANGFTKIKVHATNIIDNEYKLFERYTYPQDSIKYLMFPYEAFGIDLQAECTIANSCVDDLIINAASC